jgi:hypothetical protein
MNTINNIVDMLEEWSILIVFVLWSFTFVWLLVLVYHYHVDNKYREIRNRWSHRSRRL